MREQFTEPAAARIVAEIDAIARQCGSRERVFDDLLTLAVCALAGGTREQEYLATVKPYTAGVPGKRAIDQLVDVFARILVAMGRTDSDLLGEIFESSISRGDNGQHFTPDPVAMFMARMVDVEAQSGQNSESDDETGRPKIMLDPCCGSGRLLLAAAKTNRNQHFVGQDIDHTCVKMTALNLALRNLSGRVIWGNTLTDEVRRVYHTGFNGRGFIRVEEANTQPLTLPFAAMPADPAFSSALPALRLPPGRLFDESGDRPFGAVIARRR